MGEGPQATYLFLGNGQLSRHLQAYFRLLQLPFRVWTRSSEHPLAEALKGSTHVLLAITDSALVPFLETHDLGSATPVHFSGSISTPLAWGAHPLMTFAGLPYTLDVYRQVPFVLDEDAPPFEQLLPGLDNPHHRLAAEKKPLYHAMCVLSGNFTTLLWQSMFAELQRLGLPAAAALPYLRQTAANLESASSPLSGPLVRGDQGTIQNNLQALEGSPLQAIYASFVEAFAAQAVAR
ncbi:unnamed protein product [Phaeothamnion confervicola]